MKELFWGSVGCGDVCERKSGPALYGVEGSHLVAVMRRTLDKAEDFAQRHGVPRFYGNIGALLGDPDVNAVYVATPNNTHLEPVLAAAAAGKHVLCEKPMARNTAACQKMIDACREADVLLAVAYYRRCYPSVLRAMELVDSGTIGALKEIRVNDEFPLSHRLDLVHYFAGDAVKVWATNEDLPPGSHAERGEVLHVLTGSGVEAVMNIGWEEKSAPETVMLRGESGEIDIDDLKGGHLSVRGEGMAGEEAFDPLPATHWGLVENFVRHYNGSVPLACDGVEGRKSTVILDIVNELAPGMPEMPVDYMAET